MAVFDLLSNYAVKIKKRGGQAPRYFEVFMRNPPFFLRRNYRGATMCGLLPDRAG